jgi:asparagine synthase (glutamine-hydrolysing)
MCGISGIVLKKPGAVSLSEKIILMSQALSHRGPDGEGFIVADSSAVIPYFNFVQQQYTRHDLTYVPKQIIAKENNSAFLAFGHRRLAIIDLSDTGHQPMYEPEGKTWITYNGEIYNYIELREQLKKLGHTFISESDTEVILKAYKEWGFECVKRFNGMWAFCIYDTSKKICFASRDRLGVKPFYYVNNNSLFAFASEQKAFIKSGIVSARISQKALHDYLVNGLMEHEDSNFFEGITELWPGNNLVYDLTTNNLTLNSYFHLNECINLNNDRLSEKELTDKINFSLETAIALRLRSDVEVGTCLSGGIDSSVLAVTIYSLTQKPLYCFTSVFRGKKINEEHFADLVTSGINARHLKIEPTLEGFIEEADKLIYSQDVPIWSTSTYAQYKVMELAKQNNIKVVLDGQGADELFGGYHHHFAAKWNNLITRGNYLQAIRDISASGKTIPSPFLFYLKERVKYKNNFNKNRLPLFFTKQFIESDEIKNPTRYFNDVNRQLQDDIYETRLKAFLKCEDRCGMWHSVESRTPFSDDIDLIKLMFSFNGNKKIKNGISKYFLREAAKKKLPPEIYNRHDKKGFETPMKQWVLQLAPQMISEIKRAQFDFVNHRDLEKINLSDTFNYQLLFKLFVLCRWQEVFNARTN